MAVRIKPAEIQELMERALDLLRRQIPDPKLRYTESKLGNYTVIRSPVGIRVYDGVASVVEFDPVTFGVFTVQGGPALKALLNLRKLMVLDDLADV